MIGSDLESALDNAAAEVSGVAGSSLYARVNALSVFQSKQVPRHERPRFSPDLPNQAYEKAHDYLLLGLKHLYTEGRDWRTDAILEMAGQLLEKLYLEVPSNPPDRTRELYNAALAYYLSGHYARAYVIMKGLGPLPNTPSPLSLLRLIFLKDIPRLRQATLQLLTRPVYSDAEIAEALREGEISEGEVIGRVLEATLNRVTSLFIEHTRAGREELLSRSLALLETSMRFSLDQSTFDWWWLFYCTKALLQEYNRSSLWTVLRPLLEEDPSGLIRAYIQVAWQRTRPIIELWRTQVHAMPHINDPARSSYCIKMPTSAGKTRIAETAILRFLIDNPPDSEKKCLYIAPYRALALEIEETLGQSFGKMGITVSELYGGFDLNPTELQLFVETRILIATPEKSDAFLRYKPKLADQIGLIIIDEGHIIDRGTRGLRYEIFLHRLVRRFANHGVRLLFISAVMPNVEQFTKWITNRSVPDGLITSDWRASQLLLGVLKWDGQTGRVDYLYRGLKPIDVPMFFNRFMVALPSHELRRAKAGRYVFPRKGRKNEAVALAALEAVRDGPTLVFASQPRLVNSIADAILQVLTLQAKLAQNRGVSPEGLPGTLEPESIRQLERCIRMAEETTGPTSLVVRALKARFIIHHGDIPKRLRAQLEVLAREGAVSLTIATNTLAQGVNLPVKTILIHSLVQGQDRYIPATDFWNICGRAGRAMSENEGLILLLADETSRLPSHQTAEEMAKRSIRRYVREAQSHALESAIKEFLASVTAAWAKSYPNATVAELCEQLADNEIDWLSESEQHLLEVLDAQLLALLEETASTETKPESVQDLFERSMLLLQLSQPRPGERLTLSTALNILTSRIEYVSRVVSEPKRRRQFYRMGLALSDCVYIQTNRSQIEQTLALAVDYMDWSTEERAEYLVHLCREHLIPLSDVRPEDPANLPACWPIILHKWLLGQTAEQIYQDCIVASELGSTMRVSIVIDDLCDYRLPWGFSALYAFLEVEAELEITMNNQVFRIQTESLPIAAFYFPSMVRFGVPSPVATILLTLGLTSRIAAIAMAENYSGPTETSALLAWVASLTVPILAQWQIDALTQISVLEFMEQIRERQSATQISSQKTKVYALYIPDPAFLSPLTDGTTLFLQPLQSPRIAVYTPAIELLGILEIEDDHIYQQVENGLIAATLCGDLKKGDGGLFQVNIALLPIGI